MGGNARLQITDEKKEMIRTLFTENLRMSIKIRLLKLDCIKREYGIF